ncbi:MAG: hypothetical protein ACSLEX_02180 [Minisyncoccota bacterium]
MILGLLRLIVWGAGVITIAYFALPYFGYEINTRYFEASKSTCQEHLTQCQKDLLKTGLDGAKETCDFQCVNPKFLIQKK